MKTSEISSVNSTITKFIVDMAVYEELFLKEAPDVWEAILMSMSTLSNVSTFLESVKYHEAEEDLAFFNKLLEVNNLPKLSGLKLEKFLNKERDINLERYKSAKTSGDK